MVEEKEVQSSVLSGKEIKVRRREREAGERLEREKERGSV